MEIHQPTHAGEETEEVSVSNNDKWAPYSSVSTCTVSYSSIVIYCVFSFRQTIMINKANHLKA